MMKKLAFLFFISFSFYEPAIAQFVDFGIPISISKKPGKDLVGYYHPGNNQIIINVQTQNGITHFLYDTSFNLLKQYDVITGQRQLSRNKKKGFFLKNICLQNEFLEVYAEGETIVIYLLDITKGQDMDLARIGLGSTYKNEKLVAVMPNGQGCNFLCVSLKDKKIILYKWEFSSNKTVTIETAIPKSTLSKEEIKEKGDFPAVKPGLLFQNLSVSYTGKPDIFQFPLPGQLFYNDSCIYVIHKIPYQMGINVLKIDPGSGMINSKNYFINKYSDRPLQYLETPVATVYDSLLIIQNSSSGKFEYYFYNIVTGNLQAKYETKTNNELYNLVHSPLRQVGTFGSADEEKELDNEKRFLKRKNSGMSFIKPLRYKDSLVLTFGSFVPTEGIEGVLLSAATMGISSVAGVGIAIGEFHFVPYLTISRNKFLYAHSRFALTGLRSAPHDSVTTYLDAVIADKKLSELERDNSLMIDLGQKIYICIYDPASKKFRVSKYQ